MKLVKLLLFFLMLSTVSLLAAEPDYRSYFSHPAAQIRILLGKVSSKAVPFKNHSVPKSASETPHFSNGSGSTGFRPDNPFVEWRFVEKTDYGDLYIFAIKQHDTLTKAVPVLFSGSTITVYDQDDIHVEIVPLPNASNER